MRSKVITLAGIAIITCFALQTAHAANNNSEKVIAEVNGYKITEGSLKRYASKRNLPPGGASPQQRAALIEELINRAVIYQDAVALGVDKTPAIKSEIEFQRINVVASTMINRSSDRFSVDEADMKKEYETRKGELGGKELKARHILVTTEKTAKDLIAKLDKGGEFAKLAGKHSTGPSAVNGGDLGWFKTDQMVKEFSVAASKLKKGNYTKKAVKTQFGWHVILLEDSRFVEAPSYGAVKEQIRVGMQNLMIEKYIGKLRSKATIKRN
ncbi:MAG: peptidylprolyl isomerase [Gammaproteobacteria bacterium]|nr:peptidylprolyl isomerase [Gammaproteobacteria bacterium]